MISSRGQLAFQKITVNDTDTGFKISVFNCNNVLFGTKTGLSKIQIENYVYTLNTTTNNYKNSLKITTGLSESE